MPKSPKPEEVASSPRYSGKRDERAPSLKEITRRHPTDAERDALIDLLWKSDGIVTAILGQAMVEIELDNLLRRYLRHADDKSWDVLTEQNGPLGSFYSKISLGRALNLYDETTKDHLNRIRVIRNAFAHSKRIVTFDAVAVRQEIRDAALPTKIHSERYKDVRRVKLLEKREPKVAYMGLCVAAYTALIKKRTRSTVASNRNYSRKYAKVRRNALADALSFYPESELYQNTLLQAVSIDDPTLQSTGLIPASHRRRLSKNDDSAGN